MSDNIDQYVVSRTSKDRSRSDGESPKWTISDHEAQRTYGAIIQISPLRGKSATVGSLQIDESAKQTQKRDTVVHHPPIEMLISTEGGMQELRAQQTALTDRQEATTNTPDRLVGDLRTALRIIVEQHETLKQKDHVIQNRKDQMTSHQDWIDQQQMIQEANANAGRLFRAELRGHGGMCSRGVEGGICAESSLGRSTRSASITA